MSRFDSESLNAPHTQRHLDEIPQRGPTAEKMAESALSRAGLVKRLRESGGGGRGCEAADCIEHLEAELERRKSLVFAQSLRHTSALMRAIGNRQAERDQAHEDYMALMDEMNAEKVLADRLYYAWLADEGLEGNPVEKSYRKARGL